MASTIAPALDEAEPKPPDAAGQSAKTQFAVRLSNALAKLLADALRPRFPGILPGPGGEGIEAPAAAASGSKRLDVNFSTSEKGLGLGVSVKTISFRDPKSKRYTHNMKRVDEELLAEAIDYHVRQPYAVLIGLYFLPADGCDDGKDRSSFGSWVAKLFSRAGRQGPEHHPELVERIFVGIYESEGANRGDVVFFDVRTPPPRRGRPSNAVVLTWDQLIAEIQGEYEDRNGATFRWADE
jgi:hypothetical protein